MMSTKRISLFFSIFAVFLLISALLVGVVLPTSLNAASASYVNYGSFTLNNRASVSTFGDSFDLFFDTWLYDNDGTINSPSYRSDYRVDNNTDQSYLVVTSPFSGSTSSFTLTRSSDTAPVVLTSSVTVSEFANPSHYNSFDVPTVYLPFPDDPNALPVPQYFYLSHSETLDVLTPFDENAFFTYNLFYDGLTSIQGSNSLDGSSTLVVQVLFENNVWSDDIVLPLSSFPTQSSCVQSNVNSYSLKSNSIVCTLPVGTGVTLNNVTYADRILQYRIKRCSYSAKYYGSPGSYLALFGQSLFYGGNGGNSSFFGIGEFGYNFYETYDDALKNASNNSYEVGYNKGYSVGRDSGYTNGYYDGYNNGSYNGFQDGYSEGLVTSSTGNWTSLFRSVVNSPLESIFGKYDDNPQSSTFGMRVNGLLTLQIPIGDQVLDLSNFLLGILSALLVLSVVRIVLKFV